MENPRTTIHQLWVAFVPSIVCLSLYAALFTWIAGLKEIDAVAGRIAGLLAGIPRVSVDPEIKNELLKLTPILALFALALVLYLFDRVALGLGHLLPPYPYWSGSLLARLDEEELRGVWLRSKAPVDLNTLLSDAERLIEDARAENRSRLLTTLEYRQQQFSSAFKLIAYGKTAVLWSFICAVIAVRTGTPAMQAAFRSFLVATLATGVVMVGIAIATHWLLEITAEQVRIAETMMRLRGQRFEFSADRQLELEHARLDALRHEVRFLRLSWGSIRSFRRLLGAIRRAPNQRLQPAASDEVVTRRG